MDDHDTSMLNRTTHLVPLDAEIAVRLTGRDAVDWLHRISSQEIRKAPLEAVRPALLLDDHGRIVATFDVVRAADHVRLWVARDQLATVLERFEFYHFAEDVVWEPEEGRRRALLVGAEAERFAGEFLGRTLDGRTAAAEADAHVGRDERYGVPAWLLEVPEGGSERLEALQREGVRRAAATWLATLRIEAGVPRWPEDLDGGVFPHEARMAWAFDLDKGCYPGQETVARMDTYGGPQRKLYGFRLAGTDALTSGEVLLDGDPVGRVTSGTRSTRLGGPISLGYVKKRAWRLGATVGIRGPEGERSARVEDLPFPR